ncbi:MAG: L-seryl-tRNA(Sec) selenium transferase [Oligoflexia bacterium]|nr:L-seryl-tRNA(Sec) selenium transferase [Oligoflexia bacterium]
MNNPPSVTEIIKLLRKEAPTELPNALLAQEARKIQKNKLKLGPLVFNNLPTSRRSVINGTGILLHTNLGRAPLGQAVIDRINNVLAGYTNLEMDLQTGERGGRTAYLDVLFECLNQKYKPVWVNNNAAAVLLCLSTLKKTTGLTRMIISRGELVEIGGGFRVPEIMKEAGFDLIEVGTTNKTRLEDYKNALSEAPGVICCVHPSNFVMQGFVESVEPKNLIPLCSEFKVPLLYDAGTLDADEIRKLPDGFDFVSISTDKTLGGPQGGLIMAKPDVYKSLLKNPLYRALRLDKLSLTALEVTFEAHADKTDRLVLPISQMLNTNLKTLQERVREMMKLPLQNFKLVEAFCQSSWGGGALPGQTWESVGISIIPIKKANDQHQKITTYLRQNNPSVLASIVNGEVTINLTTVLSHQLEAVKKAIRNLDIKLFMV